jgi:multidrug resistance efflux pump
MKKQFLKILSKPKFIIPIIAVIGIIIIVVEYNNVGVKPVVNLNSNIESSYSAVPGSTVNLAFPKSGRLVLLEVKNRQTVYKGETLAKLSAPDQEGLVSQAKGALNLAEAQYASLNSQYRTTKNQQDLIVKNAYQTLLSSGIEGTPDKQDKNVPIISGTYTCGKEGSYVIDPYASADENSGYSFNFSGLESGISSVKYDNPVPFGNCGLQIKFTNVSYFNPDTTWTINIPNTKSVSYLTNKNAYELAIENRDKVLSDLSTTIGTNDSGVSVAKASVDAARGAYEAALGAYQNNLIIAPSNGVINFIDKDLIVGQSITPNKTVISITVK